MESQAQSVVHLSTPIRANSVERIVLQGQADGCRSHFERCELAQGNTWSSYSTKKCYAGYLKRWIVPQWGKYELGNIKTIEVESWLRRLPLAKGSCAKIRGVMSVLFNHACRYELFDRNPIQLVRQGAKRKKTPCVLTPAEIRVLSDGLAIRERTLVLLAASTGLRQSELFALKWSDITLTEATMNVTSSIVCGVVGPCKTESSQKPVPIHPVVVEALEKWKEHQRYRKPGDWVFASGCRRGRQPYWG
jgi:integrase